eukprot:gene9609-14923_t
MSTSALLAGLTLAAQYLVGRNGAANFTSVQACVDSATAGDTCTVSAGMYKETVVVRNGVELKGLPGATLVGSEALPDNWELWKGQIYRQMVPQEFRFRIVQAFVDGNHMTEARWPNAVMADYLNASSWATEKSGSVYGMLVDPDLAATNIDWTGAIATLNTDIRVYTYTRTVQNYTLGSDHFNYTTPLPGTKERPPSHYIGSLYYLSGLLDALDSPGEWFFDNQTNYFYMWMPDAAAPGTRVSVRVRDLCYDGLQQSPNEPLKLSGFNMVSCTYTMQACDGCMVSDLNITYPTHIREIEFREPDEGRKMPNSTFLLGNDSTIERVHLKYSSINGLLLIGFRNRVEDCLIESTNWLGSLDFPSIYIGFGKVNAGHHLRPQIVWGEDNVITRVTLNGFGNSGIVTSQLSCEVSYAYVKNGGLIGCDHAGIHADNDPAPCMFNTSASNCTKYFHHNWVHDCREKCFRGDDASVNMTVHDQVIFNCGWFDRDPVCGDASAGLVIKGDYHTVYSVTVFNVSDENHRATGDAFIPTSPGPPPPGCNATTCRPENAHSSFWNIAAHKIDNTGGPPLNQSAVFVGAMYQGNYSTYGLADPDAFNFVPLSSSPLYESGTVRPPFTPIVDGHAPNVGGMATGD